MSQGSAALTSGQQPVGRVYSAGTIDGQRTELPAWDLPASASSIDPNASRLAPPPKPDDAGSSKAPQRVAPALERDLEQLEAGAAADRNVTLVVTFVEDQAHPRFPSPDLTLGRAAAVNQAALSSAQAIVASLEQKRAPVLDRLAAEFGAKYGAREIGRFWLIKGMTFTLPLSSVRAVTARADVQYAEYDQTDIPPPAGDPVDARGLMNTDYYYDDTGYWIGLLDTGIRATHTLLSSPNVYDYYRDCVNGTNSDCTTGTGLDPADDFWDHGTSSASIISGNGNLGNTYQGVTPITLDSWKIYSSGGFVTSAGVRAFQAAAAALDRVIVAEIQDTTSDTGAISTAADAAFDSGATVVAAAGNYGPNASTVAAPGNAHKALAIGAVDVTSLGLESYSGRGPAPDNRYKPDLVGPTNVYAASNSSDTALQDFTGTSCATPFAGAATALGRNFVRNGADDVDPGQADAFMILGGTQRDFDNDQGAGLTTILTGGWFWWGAVSVSSNGQNVDIPLDLTPTAHVNAAIWWPESPSAHNDVDLYLLEPDGSTADVSESSPGIFEKVSATSNLQTGTWTLRVHGYSMSTTQTVYWAIHQL